MKANFFDDNFRKHLYPLTLTRPTAALRIGVNTIAEKWEAILKLDDYGYKTENYLSELFPKIGAGLFINGRVLPTERLAEEISKLKEGEYLVRGDVTLAYFGNSSHMISYTDDVEMINRCHDIFAKVGEEIERDFHVLTEGRESQKIHPTVIQIKKHPIFIEEGVKAQACILNSSDGPIYIGKNAQIMEGAMVRGPFSLGENSTLKMGAKIYGPTAVGPHCKVGGEVNNSVFLGYSNKGHDGFLGNAVLGEWCNLGADTNNSNLKNNYDQVRIWNYEMESFERTGMQFCGLVMGDHSKTGINTMLNTGTVVGVSANIYGGGFPRNFIPSFAWGGSSGFSTYQINKAIETAKNVYQRRGKNFGVDEEHLFEYIFKNQSQFRNWEKR